MNLQQRMRSLVLILAASIPALSSNLFASSHREAPYIAGMPKLDGTDFYMFRSYEDGRSGYVTFLANYMPLQDAYGGPNYFDLSSNALYEIHIDNDGDAREDMTFSFRFSNVEADLQVPTFDGTLVSVPLKNIGGIGPNAEDTTAVNVRQTYSIEMIEGDRRTGTRMNLANADTNETTFMKPVDNIGDKSFSDYESYANDHIYDLSIPNCDNGRVFVGQRKEGFAVNLGEVFDLVNLNPLGLENENPNVIGNKNITTLALEIPIDCLTSDTESVIGAWTTSSIRQAQIINPTPSNGKEAAIYGGAWTQISRLGMPLVNEVVIGLKDKNLFNASEPKDDTQFLTYVTNPTLPELLEILFPGVAVAPNVSRTDLVEAFLTGINGLNQPSEVTPSEMLRLNTSIAPTEAPQQHNMGVLGGDLAGFPNGRRPGDDVVDAALRVAMGALLPLEDAPNKNAPLTDGTTVDSGDFMEVFPYLHTPVPGATNDL